MAPSFLRKRTPDYSPGYEEMQQFNQGPDEDTDPNDADDRMGGMDSVTQMEKARGAGLGLSEIPNDYSSNSPDRKITEIPNDDASRSPWDQMQTLPDSGSASQQRDYGTPKSMNFARGYATSAPSRETSGLRSVPAPRGDEFQQYLKQVESTIQNRKPPGIGRLIAGNIAGFFGAPGIGSVIINGNRVAEDNAMNQISAMKAKAAADEQTKIKDALQQQSQEYVNQYHQGLVKESGERTRTMAENRTADRIGREMIASDKSNIEAKRRATGTYGEGLTEEQAFSRTNVGVNPNALTETPEGMPPLPGESGMSTVMQAEAKFKKPWADTYETTSINPTTGEKTFETRYATKQVEIPIGLEGRFRPGTERVPYSEMKTALGLQGQENQADIAAAHDAARAAIASQQVRLRGLALQQGAVHNTLMVEQAKRGVLTLREHRAELTSKNIFASEAEKRANAALIADIDVQLGTSMETLGAIGAQGGNQQRPPALPAGPAKGATRQHQGNTYTFDGMQWVKVK